MAAFEKKKFKQKKTEGYYLPKNIKLEMIIVVINV